MVSLSLLSHENLRDFVGHLRDCAWLDEIYSKSLMQKRPTTKTYNCVVRSVPADGLALPGAKTSAVTFMADFVFLIYAGPEG